MSARSNSFAVARTTSQGSRRSRMTRSSTWGNSRFAEGPPVQPKSQLKELRSWSIFCGWIWMESKDGSQSMKKDGGVDIYILYICIYTPTCMHILVDVILPWRTWRVLVHLVSKSGSQNPWGVIFLGICAVQGAKTTHKSTGTEESSGPRRSWRRLLKMNGYCKAT